MEMYLVPETAQGAPLKVLVGMQKLNLAKGAHTTVQATIDPRQLSLVDEKGDRAIQPGKYELYVGGSQPLPGQGVSLPFEITGSAANVP